MKSLRLVLHRAAHWLKRSPREKAKSKSPAVEEGQAIDQSGERQQPKDFQPPPFQTLQSASPRRSTSAPLVVDEEITFNIILKYNGKYFNKNPTVRIRWADPSMFNGLQREVESCLRSHDEIPEAALLHRKSGECILRRWSDKEAVDTRILENEEQWKEVLPLMVMSFCTTYVKVPFYLDICWEYADLLIPKVDGERYVTTVHAAISAKMTKNWEGRDYMSQSSLETILSKSTITELVNQDTSLRSLPQGTISRLGAAKDFSKERFIEDIWADAIRLLALHVCTDLPLLCLFDMMEGKEGARDSKLFRNPITEEACPHKKYVPKFKTLILHQENFITHKFDKFTHVQLHDRVVVPIKTHENKGKGGFGEVFSVSIVGEHHSFPSVDKSNLFAMKIFSGYGPRTEEDFNRESKMLQTLADFPHAHITPHLASWTQSGKFYMLFPLAQCNLRAYLRTNPAQELSGSFIQWLLSQLHGLADGVRTIHNLAPAGLGPTMLDGQAKARTGFHHDLKPENILVFDKNNSGGQELDSIGPKLRISDFGSAKVSQMLSGSAFESRASYKTPSKSPGDPTYGAPESDADKGSSRPYDIFSLGCIYLEILLWVFHLKCSDLDDFIFDRLRTSQSNTFKSQSPGFWYKTKEGELKLKPAVAYRLNELTKHCKGRGIFEKLILYVRSMLTISPTTRIKAFEITNAIDAMRMSVQQELRNDPQAYLEKRIHAEFAAPPTGGAEELSSIDISETEGITNSSAQLSPNGTGHHRTRSDGKLMASSRGSLKRNSVSDPKAMLRIETDLPIINGRPRSSSGVSIAISHADDPDSVIDGLGLDELEGFEQPPPIGGHSYILSFEDFANGRPRSAKSRRSFSEGDVPSHPFSFDS